MSALFKFRDLLWLLVVREVRIRYARAVLGAAWAVFMPLVVLGVFTALDFGRLIDDSSPFHRFPYPVFAFCGILPWAHFAASLTQATPSIVSARDIIRKSAFPRETIPLSKVLAALLDFAIGGLFLVPLLVWAGVSIGPAILALPVIFSLQLAFTVGLALLLSAGNAFFRDVNYIVQVMLPIGMFGTSVVYPVSVNSPVVSAVLSLNPMSSFIDAYRESILLGDWPWRTLVPGAVGAVVALVVGAVAFQRLERRFAEEL